MRKFRSAEEIGERSVRISHIQVVLTRPYPYMFRYVWGGDVVNVGKPGWTGDRKTMLKKYWQD